MFVARDASWRIRGITLMMISFRIRILSSRATRIGRRTFMMISCRYNPLIDSLLKLLLPPNTILCASERAVVDITPGRMSPAVVPEIDS